jgi:hypothetical protein
MSVLIPSSRLPAGLPGRHSAVAPSPLSDVLAYQHPAVVGRYAKDHSSKASKAEQIFSDLMRFFWASKKHDYERRQNPADSRLDFVFIMDEEMRDIDQMWHVFLLYTQDYMDFCERYFREYLHHLPDIVPGLMQTAFDPEANLEKLLSYTYDNLGEDVIRRWFPTANE